MKESGHWWCSRCGSYYPNNAGHGCGGSSFYQEPRTQTALEAAEADKVAERERTDKFKRLCDHLESENARITKIVGLLQQANRDAEAREAELREQLVQAREDSDTWKATLDVALNVHCEERKELRARVAELEGMVPKWVPVTEKPALHGVYQVWLISNTSPSGFQGSGYCDSDGWKMVQAADEYRSDNCMFEDCGMKVTHWCEVKLPAAPKEEVCPK